MSVVFNIDKDKITFIITVEKQETACDNIKWTIEPTVTRLEFPKTLHKSFWEDMKSQMSKNTFYNSTSIIVEIPRQVCKDEFERAIDAVLADPSCWYVNFFE